MKFTADVKEFSNSIKLILSVISNSGTSFTSALVLKKDTLWVYANNDTVTARCALKGVSETEGKGIAGINLTALDNALKGREKIVFENKETVFKFKAAKGPYCGDLSIVPCLPETIDEYDEMISISKKAKTSSLDPEAFLILRSALASTNVSLIHASDVLDTYIKLNKGVLEIISSDNFHLAYCKSPCKTEANFQLSPSKTVFEVLGKLSEFYGGNTEVEFATETIKANNKSYSISTATVQSSDTSFLRGKQYVTELPKPLCSFDLNVNKVKAVMDNIFSVYEDGALTTLGLKSTKKGNFLEFSMKTSMGSISDSIEVELDKAKTFVCTFDPRMFLDSLNLSKCSEANFSYIDGKSIVLKTSKEKVQNIYVNHVMSE